MATNHTNHNAGHELNGRDPVALKILQPRDIVAIEQALEKIGAFGEIHLVIENGCLRYIRTVQSEALRGSADVKTKNSR